MVKLNNKYLLSKNINKIIDKRVLVRVDLNIETCGFTQIENYRIKIAKDLLKFLESAKQIIFISHLGQPPYADQRGYADYSLEKFIPYLPEFKFVNWKYEELKALTLSSPKKKQQMVNGKVYQKYYFNSITSGSFRFFAHQFYNEKKKKVPLLIHKWLTPLAFAVWFMDDGSIKSKECKGKILDTQGFDEKDIHLLMKAIEGNFGIDTSKRKQREGFQIYIPAREYGKLTQSIGQHIHYSMKYKLV